MSRKTGGSNDYYSVDVANTLDGRPGYTAQCLEVIEALGMTFAEGEAFKAIWRSCAARTLGKHKADNNALYDAEKVEFYGRRMIVAAGPALTLASEDRADTSLTATHRDGGGTLYKVDADSGRWLRWGNQNWFYASDHPMAVPAGLRELRP